MFYGRALKEPDGSYVVTEWITLLWLPILPLGSKRIWFDSHEPGSFWRHPVTRYQTRALSLYWPQVAWGYGITFGIFGLFWLLDTWDEYWFADNVGWLLPAGGALAAAFVLLVVLSRNRGGDRARREAANWSQSQRVALMSGAGIGAAAGVATAFALTSEGTSFFGWLMSQRYFEWSAFGWGIFGALLGGALVFAIKILK